MNIDKFKEFLGECESIDKDQADTLAKGAIVLLTILTEKYCMDQVSEKQVARKAIEMLQQFIELPL